MVHTALQDMLEKALLCRIFTGTSANLEILRAGPENLSSIHNSAILQSFWCSPYFMAPKESRVSTEQKLSCLARGVYAALRGLNTQKNFMKAALVTRMRNKDVGTWILL